jgi:hypothetical protein
MKPFALFPLLFCCISYNLSAQKKEVSPTIRPYWALMPCYSTTSKGNAFALNAEYQYRYKNIGIAGGLSLEYATSQSGGIGIRYRVGEIPYNWKPSVPSIYQSSERWVNLAPSLLGYYYLGEKGNWEGFFKTGIVANYTMWYSYDGLEYKTDFMGKVIDAGFTSVSQTTNSIDLQSINWLIGGGVQYKLGETAAFRIASEVQWARGISILGGFVFKI